MTIDTRTGPANDNAAIDLAAARQARRYARLSRSEQLLLVERVCTDAAFDAMRAALKAARKRDCYGARLLADAAERVRATAAEARAMLGR